VGYGGGEQNNQRNRGPPPTNSRDAKIEAILNQRHENDRCIVVAMRSGKTTLEQHVPVTGSKADENNLGPEE
ncbi:hypothetical protein HAX54_038765, partial [Datura stramonium]|nr:hypothetical protein [Datura stramonium]